MAYIFLSRYYYPISLLLSIITILDNFPHLRQSWNCLFQVSLLLLLLHVQLCIYNAKSVKDYKYFFYQYSEFHVFTRQSSVGNCYQWYQIRMTSIQEGTQVSVTHVGQSHPAKTFNGSHPLNVFAEQPILNSWEGSGCRRHCQISLCHFKVSKCHFRCLTES